MQDTNNIQIKIFKLKTKKPKAFNGLIFLIYNLRFVCFLCLVSLYLKIENKDYFFLEGLKNRNE